MYEKNELIDIDLVNGQDFTLDTVNDLSTATGTTAIIYGLIRRLLVHRGTWQYDPTFGSELYKLLQSKSAQSITEDEVADIVYDAAYPMIFEGKLDSIEQVRITNRGRKTITIEITARIGQDVLTTALVTSTS